jgi:DNA-binding MarR family transcriptional regulator
MVDEYARWLAASAYRGIQPAHAAAIQPLWQRPDGARLTDLAQTARITKSLEQGGYVERVQDPDDGRATRVRLTARGRSFARDARKFAREVEDRMAARIGKGRLEDLRAALELIVEPSRR